MSGIWFPECYWCKHFHAQTAMKPPRTCDAFPDGLPGDIFAGYFDHQMPYPDADDHGIQFEEQLDTQALPDFLRDMTDDVRLMFRDVMKRSMREKIESLKGKKWQPDPNKY